MDRVRRIRRAFVSFVLCFVPCVGKRVEKEKKGSKASKNAEKSTPAKSGPSKQEITVSRRSSVVALEEGEKCEKAIELEEFAVSELEVVPTEELVVETREMSRGPIPKVEPAIQPPINNDPWGLGDGPKTTYNVKTLEKDYILDLVVGNECGRGMFGVVHSATHPEEKNPLAVKTLEYTWDSWMDLMTEVRIMAKLSECTQFPRLVGYFTDTSVFMILMQFVNGISLCDLIDYYTYTNAAFRYICRKIALGMEELHSRSILHRDLKSENVLVCLETGTVRIIDFGFAREGKSFGGHFGTISYMAPEVVRWRGSEAYPYDLAADVYSYGMVACEVFCKRTPYDHMKELRMEEEDIIQRIVEGRMEYLMPDEKIPFSQCRRLDPGDRPTAHDLLEHDFFLPESIEPVLKFGLSVFVWKLEKQSE